MKENKKPRPRMVRETKKTVLVYTATPTKKQ